MQPRAAAYVCFFTTTDAPPFCAQATVAGWAAAAADVAALAGLALRRRRSLYPSSSGRTGSETLHLQALDGMPAHALDAFAGVRGGP